MPEHDKKERIGGETVLSSSSDAAIQAKIVDISRDLHGLSRDEFILDGENLAPLPITKDTQIEETAPELRNAHLSDLSHDHSAYGSAIRAERLKKKGRLNKAA